MSYKWYTKSKLFMDGSFDVLKPEEVEVYVDDSYKWVLVFVKNWYLNHLNCEL